MELLPYSIMNKACPLELWTEAIKQAKRSDHKRHRTGCVIYRRSDFKVITRGCSHTHNGGLKVRSVHAEMDALSKLKGFPMFDALVVTLTRVDRFAKVSKPCVDCAKHLGYYCRLVTFCEQANDGSWTVIQTEPSLLTGLSETRYLP